METEYGKNRKYFHNVRFSPEEEKIIRERMEKYNYTRVSDFIRDAVLDKRLTQRQVVEIEPYKIDNNRLVPQVIDAIRTYDFRLVRVIAAFEEALNIPYVDPELIHMHARRLRLIGAALGGKIEWLIRFMEETIKLRVSLFGLFCKFVKSQKKSIWKSASSHFLRLVCVV